MYTTKDYLQRGYQFAYNQTFPAKKKLSTLMLYATDLCNSRCKHCLIWAKKPIVHLPKKDIVQIMNSKCVTKQTSIGLEGGEFVLHPEAMDILQWFKNNHKNYDLLSNCLLPDKTIEAVTKFSPKRLFLSLDGTKETYKEMRGKDGYDKVIRVIENVHKQLPVSVMFTLSPYNSYADMYHVSKVCEKFGIDLRVGIYNNIAYFDTTESAHKTEEELNIEVLKKDLQNNLGKHKENAEFILLYHAWRKNELKLNCYSIFDSLVVLPNGDVPICQNLDLKLGNIYNTPLDEIFNCNETIQQQKHHCKNCNKCWINFHRKYDIVLFKNFEKMFGKAITGSLLGNYNWQKTAAAKIVKITG
jgi:MoaA/NifB/PqqE/SkfB family radical SAM enzyme